jgi:hypothetical protein
MIETSRQLLELELNLGAQPEFAAHCPLHTDGRSTFQRVAGKLENEVPAYTTGRTTHAAT